MKLIIIIGFLLFLALTSCSAQEKRTKDSLLHYEIGSRIKFPKSLEANGKNAIIMVLVTFKSNGIEQITFLNNNSDTSIRNTVKENLNTVNFDKVGKQYSPLLLTYVFIQLEGYENNLNLSMPKDFFDFDIGRRMMLENCRILKPIYSYNPSTQRINN